MSDHAAAFTPPFCPNARCPFHRAPTASWRWVRAGGFRRRTAPHRIQRFRCDHCRRHFSTQTFSTTYWLKRPELLLETFHALTHCTGFRQLARKHGCSPQSVMAQALRLGRHCLLFHERLRPRGEPTEPLTLDGLRTFESSQYQPSEYHLAIGQGSHYLHGFTHSELRRSGTMTARQRRRRAVLERRHGRPDPRAVEREVARLLALVTGQARELELHSDENPAYPRAAARLAGVRIRHHTISSRAARTSRNPLFAVNLFDGLVRHSCANHKRETIAFSKRHQSVVERAAWLLLWQNWSKPFSERHGGGTPAMRAGYATRPIAIAELLRQRRFPERVGLPEIWARYYRGEVRTVRIANERRYRFKLAR
jgi:transposase-like protein